MRNSIQLSDEAIRELYVEQKLSSKQIARLAGCSEGGINHRLAKLNIQKRDMSEAMYVRSNPDGDPFSIRIPVTAQDWQLFGLGLGLYWGEGTKVDMDSVRICNSDPRLLIAFMKFMERFFRVQKAKIKIQLHIFSDIDVERAMRFWAEQFNLGKEHFSKPVIIPAGSIGTYRKRSRYGTATVAYHNVKLKRLIMKALERIALSYGPQIELTIPKENSIA